MSTSASAEASVGRRRGWRLPPAIAVLFLPALIAEALAGATPPARFFLDPIVFVYLNLYYGTGALLVREVTRRWGKGWPTLLLLGGVWGIVQEGLGTKVFFDPTRTELSPLVNYGTVGGVHWAFVVQLFIYHGIYSIVLPIMLTQVLYWSERDRLWVSRPVLWLCAVLQVAMTAVAYQNISAFKPPAELYLATLMVTTGLILIARWLPGRSTDSMETLSPAPDKVRSPRWFFVVGCLSSVGFIFVSLVLPGWTPQPLVVIGLMIAISGGTLWILRNASVRGRAWSRPHQFALAAGLLAPLIVVSPVQEMRGITGASVLGIAAAVFLLRMSRHMRPSPTPHPMAGAHG